MIFYIAPPPQRVNPGSVLSQIQGSSLLSGSCLGILHTAATVWRHNYHWAHLVVPVGSQRSSASGDITTAARWRFVAGGGADEGGRVQLGKDEMGADEGKYFL